MNDLLFVTRNLPPLVGGMERLGWHLIDALRPAFRVHVIGPAGCRRHLPADIQVDEIPPSPPGRFLGRASVLALRRARSLRPALVLAGSGLTAPPAWIAARAARARSLVYLHGLDIAPPHPGYRRLWQPCFRRFQRVLVNSAFTANLAVSAGIARERIARLHPGTELPDLADRGRLRRDFRRRHQLDDAPVMLSVGRLTRRKGLAAFVRHSLPRVLASVPGTRLVVIGDNPRQAVFPGEDERQRIEAAIDTQGLRQPVRFLGQVDDAELHAAYYAADVLVFPVQAEAGNPEGFGMVAVEAAAHGLPTVAFAAGGVTDAVRDGVSGRLIPPGEHRAFADAVAGYLRRPGEASAACRAFAEDFAWPVFGERLRNLCLEENP